MATRPGLRKFTFTTHITSSLGWVGAVIAFLAIAVIALTSPDERTVRGAYLVMAPAAWFVLVPLAHVSLLSGIVLSLGTTWGLFRYYWVVLKLVITVFCTVILLIYMGTFRQMAGVAADPIIKLEAVRNASPVLRRARAVANRDCTGSVQAPRLDSLWQARRGYSGQCGRCEFRSNWSLGSVLGHRGVCIVLAADRSSCNRRRYARSLKCLGRTACLAVPAGDGAERATPSYIDVTRLRPCARRSGLHSGITSHSIRATVARTSPSVPRLILAVIAKQWHAAVRAYVAPYRPCSGVK